MKPAILAFAVVMPSLLSACGIPDLIAHGVKSYEHGQSSPDYGMTRQPAPVAQPQPASYTPARQPTSEPPVSVEAVPPRESVVAEPLQ